MASGAGKKMDRRATPTNDEAERLEAIESYLHFGDRTELGDLGDDDFIKLAEMVKNDPRNAGSLSSLNVTGAAGGGGGGGQPPPPGDNNGATNDGGVNPPGPGNNDPSGSGNGHGSGGGGGGGGGGGSSSYAAAAAAAAIKKPPTDYSFALYVQRGKVRREAIARGHFDAFMRHCFMERLQYTKEKNASIHIDFEAWKDGYGVVACLDNISSDWIKGLAADFQYGSETTRAWSRWERGQAWVFSGFLHGNHFKSLKPKFAISSILKINGLKGEFEDITWNTKTPNGVYVSFVPIGPLLQELEGKKKLNGGTCIHTNSNFRTHSIQTG